MTIEAGINRIAKELGQYNLLKKCDYRWGEYVYKLMYENFGIYHWPKFLNHFLRNEPAENALSNIIGRKVTILTSGVKEIEIDVVARWYSIDDYSFAYGEKSTNIVSTDRIVAIDGKRIDLYDKWAFKGKLTKLINQLWLKRRIITTY